MDIKNFIVCSFAPIAAYFSPIENILKAVLLLLALNFVFGLAAGILVDRDGFNFKKAFACFIQVCIFAVIMACAFYIGDHMGDKDGALYCVSSFGCVLIYFYSVNIFRNLKLIFPKNRVFAFAHYVLSVEFITKIQYLENYLKQEKQ
ncbi:phage holin family protein [Phocaeicola sp.]